MLNALSVLPAADASAPAVHGLRIRSPMPTVSRSGLRSRVLFLRHYLACGEVRRAAEQAGIARATLYRWRAREPRFRARWEEVTEQHRHVLEDRLMQISREGERSPVFYKGVQVGWQAKNSLRAMIALLAHFDRREQRQQRERERAEKLALVSRPVVSQPSVSHPFDSAAPVSHARTTAGGEKRVSVSHATGRTHDAKRPAVSHSNNRFLPDPRVFSKGWFHGSPRKTPPLTPVLHRLQDDWGLPKRIRRLDVRPGPIAAPSSSGVTQTSHIGHMTVTCGT